MWGHESPTSHGPSEDQALELLSGAFGPPVVLGSDPWRQFRWSLPRPDRPALNLYLTIDRVHTPASNHVLIGDPCRAGRDSVAVVTLSTPEDIGALIHDVRARVRCE